MGFRTRRFDDGAVPLAGDIAPPHGLLFPAAGVVPRPNRGKAKPPPKEKQRRKEKAPLRETPVPERRRRPLGPVVIASLAVFALIAFGGTTLVFSFSQLEYGLGMTEHKFSSALRNS